MPCKDCNFKIPGSFSDWEHDKCAKDPKGDAKPADPKPCVHHHSASPSFPKNSTHASKVCPKHGNTEPTCASHYHYTHHKPDANPQPSDPTTKDATNDQALKPNTSTRKRCVSYHEPTDDPREVLCSSPGSDNVAVRSATSEKKSPRKGSLKKLETGKPCRVHGGSTFVLPNDDCPDCALENEIWRMMQAGKKITTDEKKDDSAKDNEDTKTPDKISTDQMTCGLCDAEKAESKPAQESASTNKPNEAPAPELTRIFCCRSRGTKAKPSAVHSDHGSNTSDSACDVDSDSDCSSSISFFSSSCDSDISSLNNSSYKTNFDNILDLPILKDLAIPRPRRDSMDSNLSFSSARSSIDIHDRAQLVPIKKVSDEDIPAALTDFKDLVSGFIPSGERRSDFNDANADIIITCTDDSRYFVAHYKVLNYASPDILDAEQLAADVEFSFKKPLVIRLNDDAQTVGLFLDFIYNGFLGEFSAILPTASQSDQQNFIINHTCKTLVRLSAMASLFSVRKLSEATLLTLRSFARPWARISSDDFLRSIIFIYKIPREIRDESVRDVLLMTAIQEFTFLQEDDEFVRFSYQFGKFPFDLMAMIMDLKMEGKVKMAFDDVANKTTKIKELAV